jgi:hypothetical protein
MSFREKIILKPKFPLQTSYLYLFLAVYHTKRVQANLIRSPKNFFFTVRGNGTCRPRPVFHFVVTIDPWRISKRKPCEQISSIISSPVLLRYYISRPLSALSLCSEFTSIFEAFLLFGFKSNLYLGTWKQWQQVKEKRQRTGTAEEQELTIALDAKHSSKQPRKHHIASELTDPILQLWLVRRRRICIIENHPHLPASQTTSLSLCFLHHD